MTANGAIEPVESPVETPAECRILRESLGLTAAWLARRWGVSERAVQRWESRASMPPRFRDDLWRLRVDQKRAVAAIAEPGRTLLVPRVGAADGMPTAWHRALAMRAWLLEPTMRVGWSDRPTAPHGGHGRERADSDRS